MRFRTLLALFVGTLLISPAIFATNYKMSLSLTLTDDEVISICLKSKFSSKAEGIELRSITVDDPKAMQWKPLWELLASESGVWPVKCFRYGEIVGGLTQKTEPSELEKGKLYRLSVSAPGEHGQVFFKLSEKEGKRVLEAFDQLPDEPQLKFTVDRLSCKSPATTEEMKKVTYRWLAEDKLLVELWDSDISSSIVDDASGKMSINGSALTLSYQHRKVRHFPWASVSKCLIPVGVGFTVSGISRGKYSVRIDADRGISKAIEVDS